MCLQAPEPATLRLRTTLHPRGPAAAVILEEWVREGEPLELRVEP